MNPYSLIESRNSRSIFWPGLDAAPTLTGLPRFFTKIAPPDRVGQRKAGALGTRDALMILVTGGAGFIGSNVVASLHEAGRHGIAPHHLLGSGGQWATPAEDPGIAQV